MALVLPADETVEARASLPLFLSRWLNVAASARVRVERGRLELRRLELRLGRVVLPQLLADALAPLLAAGISAERPLRPLLAAIREIRVERGAVHVRFGRVEGPRGHVAGLLWGEPVRGADEEPLRVDRRSAPSGSTSGSGAWRPASRARA